MSAGISEFDGVFLLIYVAKNRAFLDIDLGFIKIGLGLNQVGMAFFGGVFLIGALQFYLMGKVVEFGFSVAGLFQLVGGIELGQKFAGFYVRAILNKGQERELAAGAVLSRNLN